MRIRRLIFTLLFLTLSVPALCHGQAASALLGPGDVVRATVFGHPDLSGEMRIGEDGRVPFPLVGDILIGGLSTSEAEAKIADLLVGGGYVTDPRVNLFVEQRRQTLENSVLILGKIAKPGKYALEGLTGEGVQTLVDLLAVAGGTAQDSSDHLLLLRRDGDNVHKMTVDLRTLLGQGELQQNVRLIGGDIVFVPETDVFYIFGQVQSPGRYRLERGMSVMQAISVGGGIGPRGTERGIMVKRRNGNGEVETLEARLSDELRPNDVVYVKESLF
jgi:polysaccharide export outer membrane protein